MCKCVAADTFGVKGLNINLVIFRQIKVSLEFCGDTTNKKRGFFWEGGI